MFKNINEFFKKNGNIIKIILIAAMILICFISIKSCRNNNTSLRNSKIANDSLNMKIVEFVDKNKTIHARVTELELTNKELKSINTNLEVHYKNKLDSISKVLNIKSKEVQTYISIISKAKGSGEGSIIPIIKNNTEYKYKDTSYNISSNDGYLLYNGTISFYNGAIAQNKYPYDYEYTDSLNIVRFYKTKGLLGLRKEYYWDVSMANKNAKVIGLEQFSKANPNKYKMFSVVVGPNVSLTSDLKFRIQPISLTIGIKILEF